MSSNVPISSANSLKFEVVQLINARDIKTKETILFSKEMENQIISLASQGAVALTNQRLVKELKLLFASPLAWVLMAFLQGIFAWIFISRINFFITVQNQLIATPNAPGLTEITISPIYGIASILLLMSVPLLTMRLISEERRNKTITFLLSAPVSTTQIILGKFFMF